LLISSSTRFLSVQGPNGLVVVRVAFLVVCRCLMCRLSMLLTILII